MRMEIKKYCQVTVPRDLGFYLSHRHPRESGDLRPVPMSSKRDPFPTLRKTEGGPGYLLRKFRDDGANWDDYCLLLTLGSAMPQPQCSAQENCSDSQTDEHTG